MKKILTLILISLFVVPFSVFAEEYVGVVKEISTSRHARQIKVILDKGQTFNVRTNLDLEQKMITIVHSAFVSGNKIKVDVEDGTLLQISLFREDLN